MDHARIMGWGSRRASSSAPESSGRQDVRFPRALVIALIGSGALTGYSAVAEAGGILLYEAGQEDSGLANAGAAARAMDPSVMMTNPAGIVRLTGNQLYVGGQLIVGRIDFDPDGNTTTSGGDGDNAMVPTPGPSLFISHQLDERSAIGLGLYGNFGLGLDYDNDWAGRYVVQETSIVAASLQPTFAYRLTPQLSLGIGPRLVYGNYRTESAVNNNVGGASGYADGQMEYEDHDTAWGWNFGALYELDEFTRFGIAYTSKVDLDFEDRPDFRGIDNPALDTAIEQIAINRVGLGLRIPETVTASVFHRISDEWAVMGSIGWQNWSEFGDVAVELDAAPGSASARADRHYQDTWHVSLGAQRQIHRDLRWNLGIAYDSSAVKDADRTLDNPMNEAWRLATGLNYRWDESLDLTLNYTFVYLGDMDVDQTQNLSGRRVSGEYSSAYLHVIGGGVRWTF
ncbi:OmpP1/FadL family transporter [Salinicola rhizosphaerae]|uniref:OmpP1/FadL family transporter n=1 Tax=Salinicola rhizosphaerae TaxID=1443141 RepID=UPI001E64896B|nr:outer membrane protein transport protein [Salinicola rhizosphaerae]